MNSAIAASLLDLGAGGAARADKLTIFGGLNDKRRAMGIDEGFDLLVLGVAQVAGDLVINGVDHDDGCSSSPLKRQLRRREGLLWATPLVRLALREYARQRGGRFIIFGSVARDQSRYDSDMDIAVDFSAPLETAAWYFAEQQCIEHGLTPDNHTLMDLRPAVRERALQEGDVVQ